MGLNYPQSEKQDIFIENLFIYSTTIYLSGGHTMRNCDTGIVARYGIKFFESHSLMFESPWFTNCELGKFSKFFEKQYKMSLILLRTPSLVRKCKWL